MGPVVVEMREMCLFRGDELIRRRESDELRGRMGKGDVCERRRRSLVALRGVRGEVGNGWQHSKSVYIPGWDHFYRARDLRQLMRDPSCDRDWTLAIPSVTCSCSTPLGLHCPPASRRHAPCTSRRTMKSRRFCPLPFILLLSSTASAPSLIVAAERLPRGLCVGF